MTASLAELEARLVAMEHVNAIKELQTLYWTSIDRRAMDAVRDCFIDSGAVIDMEGIPPCENPDEFVKVLKANGAKPGFTGLHNGSNPLIRLTGADTAEGAWDVFFIGIDVTDRLTYQLTGRYNNKYVLRNGRWYIQTQHFRQTTLLLHNIAENGAPTVVTFGLPDASVFDKQ